MLSRPGYYSVQRLLAVLPLLILGTGIVFSAGRNTVRLESTRTATEISDNSDQGFRIRQTISSVDLGEIDTDHGTYTIIEATGHRSATGHGAPLLPVTSRLIEIPRGAEVYYNILSFRKETIAMLDHGYNNPVIPQQPPVSKSESPDDREFVFIESLYKRNEFTGPDLVLIEEIGVMRGKRIARVQISPVSYNPVRNELVVYRDLEVEIGFLNSEPAKTDRNMSLYSPLHEAAFESKIFNFREERLKTYFSGGPVRFVILSDPMFEEYLAGFVEWKTRKGFEVVEMYRGRDGVGNTPAEMRAALADLYHAATPENPAPLFLLIVGDHDQIPAFRSGGHYTDLYYAEYDGNGDFLPDLFYGRFSANNPGELMPQIEKTLMYEQYLFPDPGFLNNSVLIAGVDSRFAHVHGNGQLNYCTSYYFNESLGINAHTFPVPHQSGATQEIKDLISSGAGFVNYTGHGFWNRWNNPLLSVDDIPFLQNEGMYPLMIGNACETARFNLYESFGEAVLRADRKGAVGYIGASNDTYWDEDFYWAIGVGPVSANPLYEESGPGAFDRLFHTKGQPYTEWYVAQGQIQQAGNLAVSAGATMARTRYYWEVYHLLGDPSLMIYFSEPDLLSVDYQNIVAEGATSLAVMADPYSYVALSTGGQLFDARYTGSSGAVRLDFDSLVAGVDYELIVTRENRRPYFGSIRVAGTGSPFISVRSFSLDDSEGNNNGVAESGERISLDLVLKNYGDIPAGDLFAELVSRNKYVRAVISEYMLPDIEPGSAAEIKGGFSFDISPEVPDGEILFFSLKVTCGDTMHWVSDFTIEVRAPEIEILGFRIEGEDVTKRYGYLMAGEMAQSVLEFVNTGSAAIYDAEVWFAENNRYYVFHDADPPYNIIMPGDTVLHNVMITARTNIDYGSYTALGTGITSERFIYGQELPFRINTVYEDFEFARLFDVRPWGTCPENGWFRTPESERGRYSLRSGMISHNDTSEIRIRMKVSEPGTISFNQKVSSETRYDFLEFYIDENRAGRWSGFHEWSAVEFDVEPGNRVFRWQYIKDGSVSRGYDAAWIDDVVFPSGKLVTLFMEEAVIDIGPEELVSPVSGQWIKAMQPLIMRIRNSGNYPVTEFEAGYSLDGSAPVIESFETVLEPGDHVDVTFSVPVDLSDPGHYDFTLFTNHLSDSISHNDTLIISLTVPEVHDISLTGIVRPVSGTDMDSSEVVEAGIENTGNTVLSGFELGYSLNDTATVSEVFEGEIHPGENLLYIFATGADLSEPGTYRLMIYVLLELDVKTIGDSLGVEIENIVTGSRIRGTDHEGVSVYPNPFTGTLHIRVEGRDMSRVTLNLVSAAGILLYDKVLPVVEDNPVLRLDTPGLPPGIYYLKVSAGERIYVIPVIRK